MIRPRLTNTLLSLTILLFSAALAALPNDRSQPIRISADSAEVNDGKGISTYRGNVTMTQGSIKLDAKKVVIHSDADGVTKLIATGSPAHFQQLPEVNQQVMHAYGETIEYYITEERIELIKEAKLEQDQNVSTGDRIQYDIKQGVVNAYGSGSQTRTTNDDKPVIMVFQPKNNDDTEQQQ